MKPSNRERSAGRGWLVGGDAGGRSLELPLPPPAPPGPGRPTDPRVYEIGEDEQDDERDRNGRRVIVIDF